MTGGKPVPLEPRHLPAVVALHAASFDDAWDAATLARILALPGAHGLVVAEHGDDVAGFAIARVAADECELLSLAVAPARRRRGIGARLLVAAMGWAAARGARRFFLEVATDNLPARRLYAAHGLVAVGRRPDYYELSGGGFMDAVTLRCDLPATDAR